METQLKQRLIVRTADRKVFVRELLALGQAGARLADDSVPGFSIPFTAEVIVDVERGKEYRSTASIHAIPVPVETYTKQQMEEMVWDEFREACGALGVKGRERAVMLEEYLTRAEHYTRNSR